MRSRRFAEADQSAQGELAGGARSPVDAGSETQGHRAFGETAGQRVQLLPSHGGADHGERGAPLRSPGGPVYQNAPGSRGRLARRAVTGARIPSNTAGVTGARQLHREPKVRAEKRVQSCEVVGVDGTAADMTAAARGSCPCRPTRIPVCCGCPSHHSLVRVHGVRRQGLGAWPGAPNVVTTTPRRLLRTNRRRPPAPSPRLMRSCEVVSEQQACHSVRRERGTDPRPRKPASHRQLELSAPPTETGPSREGEAPP
jgi:hypothetical protein